MRRERAINAPPRRRLRDRLPRRRRIDWTDEWIWAVGAGILGGLLGALIGSQ